MNMEGRRRAIDLGEFQVPDTNSELSPLHERARELVLRFGGPVPVSAKSGIPLSTLNGLLKGREMRIGHVEALAEATGVSPAWLAFGEDARVGMPPPVRSEAAPKASLESTDSRVRIPIYNAFASRESKLVETGEGVEGDILISTGVSQRIFSNAKDLVIVRSILDDMEPTLGRGDLLVIDRTVTPVMNDICLLHIGGYVGLRRIKITGENEVTLSSDNSERYPLVETYPTDQLKWRSEDPEPVVSILGRVIYRLQVVV